MIVESVESFKMSSGSASLSATQNALLQAALAKYGTPKQPEVETKPQPEKIKPAQESSNSQLQQRRTPTVDRSIALLIKDAVATYQSSQGGRSFGAVLASKLEAAGIDSSKSVVDYYA